MSRPTDLCSIIIIVILAVESVTAQKVAYGGSATDGTPCVFPFTYLGTPYSACTPVGGQKEWCGTTTDFDTDKQWGYCAPPVGDPLLSYGGNQPDLTPCVFPFTYLANTYTECTQRGSTLNKFWCSTTTDFDTDKLWGYCIGNVTTDTTGSTQAVTSGVTTGTTAPQTKAAGACEDTYTELANKGAHFGIDNPATTLDACKAACSALPESQCAMIDFKASESKCYIHTSASDPTFDSTTVNNYVRQACTTTEGGVTTGSTTLRPSTTTTPPKVVGGDATTAAGSDSACQETLQELKETGQYNGALEAAAKTLDACQALCLAKTFADCPAFEFKIDPAGTEGECFLHSTISPSPHTSAGSWSTLYIRIPCTTTAPETTAAATTAGVTTAAATTAAATTAAATTAAATTVAATTVGATTKAETTAGVTTAKSVETTVPNSTACPADYSAFEFNKVPSGSGTAVASGNGDLAACKAACDRVSTTDCKAFAMKGGTQCYLYTSAAPLIDETGTTTFVRGECDVSTTAGSGMTTGKEGTTAGDSVTTAASTPRTTRPTTPVSTSGPTTLPTIRSTTIPRVSTRTPTTPTRQSTSTLSTSTLSASSSTPSTLSSTPSSTAASTSRSTTVPSTSRRATTVPTTLPPSTRLPTTVPSAGKKKK